LIENSISSLMATLLRHSRAKLIRYFVRLFIARILSTL
jgi:hypothetical protein